MDTRTNKRIESIFSASEAKQSLGIVLETAQEEDVLVTKQNRPKAFVLNPSRYYRLIELETLMNKLALIIDNEEALEIFKKEF